MTSGAWSNVDRRKHHRWHESCCQGLGSLRVDRISHGQCLVLTHLTLSDKRQWEHKEEMYQGGKGHSQWQRCASVLLVARKTSPLKACCPPHFISISLRQILNTIWTLSDSWQQPTVTSDECNSCSCCWQLMEVGWPIALTLAPSCSLLMVKKERPLHAWLPLVSMNRKDRYSEGDLVAWASASPSEAK